MIDKDRTVTEHPEQYVVQLLGARHSRVPHCRGFRMLEQNLGQHRVGGCERQRQVGDAEHELISRSTELDPSRSEDLDELIVPSRRGLAEADPHWSHRPGGSQPGPRDHGGERGLHRQLPASSLTTNHALIKGDLLGPIGHRQGEIGGENVDVSTCSGESRRYGRRGHE
nr:hypothetical protein [Nocardia abscessus]